MKNATAIILFSIIAMMALPACGGNETDDNSRNGEDRRSPKEILVGNWEIAESFRSGKKAPLGEFFLEYSSDGTFKSNLFDANQDTPFADGVKAKVDPERISFNDIPESYVIEELSDSLLILSIELRNFPFEFHFVRAED